ncbi:hypothetical protein HWB05_gp010 [Streptomyces phage BRock]|uniref:Uncharacterized protein n=1 Tax=Streptomyces phage BRock TaxID=1913591 RepID=A0A1J0GVS0_9CAUD|nr:hypothetical protein HWB05_gp010 [Streptomyces phage BRock]APC46272.1 hypothetical protein [Streptomyces phage BRock]
MSEFHTLYKGSFGHAESERVSKYVMIYKRAGKVIPDDVAQAIAGYWHSPASPNSTRLSTMGEIGVETDIADFCNDREYSNLVLNTSIYEIDALGAYIESKKAQFRHEIDSLDVQVGDVLEDCPEDGKVTAARTISVDYSGTPGEGRKVRFESEEDDILAAPMMLTVYRGF